MQLKKCCLGVFVCFQLAACDRDTHDHPEVVTGEQLFNYHCAECHDLAGQGKFLKGVPGNKDTALNTFEIEHKLKDNPVKDSIMPVFTKMPKAEAIKIVTYLKQLEK